MNNQKMIFLNKCNSSEAKCKQIHKNNSKAKIKKIQSYLQVKE